MKTRKLSAEQKEFFDELSIKFNDKVLDIEMINLKADSLGWKSFPIKPLGAKTDLWCLLIYGENKLHIYVNPTEQTILGLRVNSASKPQKEQLLTFSQFITWSINPIKRKTIFGFKEEKLRAVLKYTSNSELGDVSSFILFETTSNIGTIIERMNTYKVKHTE